MARSLLKGIDILFLAPERGRILPLHAGASAQAILAFLPAEDQRAILESALEQFTPATITDPGRLRRRLVAIRKQGYAESKGEVYPGAMGIAAPIFAREGRVVASIAVSGPAGRIAKRRRAITDHVVAAGTEVSRILGWR